MSITQERVETPTPAAITDREVAAILAAYKVDWGGFFSTRRCRKYVRARAQVVRLLRARGWSYPRIGRYLKRDHSTIIYLMEQYINDTPPEDTPGLVPFHNGSPDGV